MKAGKIKSGVIYEGKFYETGSIEWKNLMLIEGRKKENSGTLLDLISKVATRDANNIVEQN